MKTITIERSKWLRGNESDSMLLDKEGKMCCLGFYLSQCRVPKKDLLTVSTPGCFADKKELPPQAKWLIGRSPVLLNQNSSDGADLMDINDATEDISSEEHRETEIKRIFKQHNIVVDFVD
jgi:hypothetical protein